MTRRRAITLRLLSCVAILFAALGESAMGASPPSACPWYQSPPIADPMTKRYDLAGPGLVMTSTPDPDREDGSFDVGGVKFPALVESLPEGTGTICMKVQDDVTQFVRVSVCQETPDGVCNNIPIGPGMSRSGLVFGISRDRPTTVIVWAAGPCVFFLFFLVPVPCGPVAATSGTVTIQEIR